MKLDIEVEDAEWCPAGAAGWSRGGETLERGGPAGESEEKRRKRYNRFMSAEQVNSLCSDE